MWSDKIYARVMAEQETPESRKAVLAIGKAIAVNAINLPNPELVKTLPLKIGST